jgi:fatty acid desaturase
MSDNNSRSGGLGFWSVLQIVFIILKLVGSITWTWGWVLAPTWISIIFVILVIIVLVLIN